MGVLSLIFILRGALMGMKVWTLVFIWTFIHDDISLIGFVIPGSTKSVPYLIRRNPVSKIMVPCIRRDGVWIPAGVYPVLDTGQK